jgi:Asp/Glu/hydantoin racemase
MKPILAIVHFTRAAIDPIQAVFGPRLSGDVEILHFLDEAIFFHTLQHGPHASAVLKRVEDLLISAAGCGARVIVSSGSSLSPAIDLTSDRVSVPVVKIESALAAEAVARFRDVAVVVTKRSNVEPFKNLLDRLSRARGKRLRVRFSVQEAAFAALLDNAPDLHDEIVLQTIAMTAREGADAILLPQVSVARIMPRLPGDVGVPVLSSVPLSVEAVAELIGRNRGVQPGDAGCSAEDGR